MTTQLDLQLDPVNSLFYSRARRGRTLKALGLPAFVGISLAAAAQHGSCLAIMLLQSE